MNKGVEMTTSCSERVIHPIAVKKARAAVPGREELSGMGDFFKVLGDPTRLSILYALLKEELCVCDLGMVLGMSVSAVSHQLSVLRQARLVSFRRDGKVIFYSPSDSHVENVLESVRVHLAE
jgi:DNA-binding transcriptional ArsR family regulator